MTAVADLRRGWCPSVLRPMPTGDGLLVRLHPPGGALGAAQARAVAEAARACGNGLLDVTGRGNLQIRGVREETHADLVGRLIRTFPLQESAPDPSPSGEARLARSASGAGAPTPSAIDRVEHGPDAPTRLGLRPSPPSPKGRDQRAQSLKVARPGRRTSCLHSPTAAPSG